MTHGATLTKTCLEMRTTLNQHVVQGPAASSQQLWHRTLGLAHLCILRQIPTWLGRTERGNLEFPCLRKRKRNVGIHFHLVHSSVDSFSTTCCVRLQARPSRHLERMLSPGRHCVWARGPRLLALLSAGQPPVAKGGDGADGLLTSYWVLLRFIDLSDLNHPNEFAAVTSHQNTNSVLTTGLVTKKGAGDRGSVPWVTTEN